MGTSLSLLVCSRALRNSLLCFTRDVAMPSQYQYTYALHSVHEWMSRLGTIQQPACQELRPPRAHRFRPALWIWAHLTLFAQEHCANCLCFAQRCCNAVAICLHVRWCARGGCHQEYYPPWANNGHVRLSGLGEMHLGRQPQASRTRAHASSDKEGYGQFEAWAPMLKSNRCLKGVLK